MYRKSQEDWLCEDSREVKKFNFNGIIYAPNGTVTMTGYDVKFGG